MEQIQLSRFQEDWRTIIAAVQRSKQPVLIAEHGRVLVQIAPVTSAAQSWLGCLRDSGSITGDIISPAVNTEEWETLADMQLLTADKRLRDAPQITTP